MEGLLENGANLSTRHRECTTGATARGKGTSNQWEIGTFLTNKKQESIPPKIEGGTDDLSSLQFLKAQGKAHVRWGKLAAPLR